jgi:hypothetical protein
VNRFHPDEALYASWALSIAYGRDMLLAQAAPDKPPLLFYLMAGVFFILGRVEVAGRLVGLMATIVCLDVAIGPLLIALPKLGEGKDKTQCGRQWHCYLRFCSPTISRSTNVGAARFTGRHHASGPAGQRWLVQAAKKVRH